MVIVWHSADYTTRGASQFYLGGGPPTI